MVEFASKSKLDLLTLAGLVSILASAMGDSRSTSVTLLDNGARPASIVLPADPRPFHVAAATELERNLYKITGIHFPISTNSPSTNYANIYIGNFGTTKSLPPGSFSLQTSNGNLYISGAEDDGLLYGVFTFLEDYLGCRWFSSQVSYIPLTNTIELSEICNSQSPALGYREVFYRDMFDPTFARKHKLNGNSNVSAGQQLWGAWCHSFYSFIPPQKYFESHPEYFSLIDGKRTHKMLYGTVEYTTQLCLSNPGLLKTTIDELKQRISLNPHARYWSISQMDGHLAACQCAGCHSLDARFQSPIGSILTFVNSIAAEFPDLTIATLAYTYTRKPPINLTPASNVAIQLCTIECQRADASKPITSHPIHQRFREDWFGWNKLTDNIIIWDYVIQFSCLVSPYPNLSVLQPNIQSFVKHGARGVFAQGNREVGGEFCELRAYLLAKLLWNPNANLNQHMDDFLNGYYGPAAGPIRAYIDRTHQALLQSNLPLSMDAQPRAHKEGYLAPSLLGEYDAMFDRAEQLASANAEQLLRVQTARLPLTFAQLELDHGSLESRRRKAAQFFKIAEQNKITMLAEVDLTLERYKKQIAERLKLN